MSAIVRSEALLERDSPSDSRAENRKVPDNLALVGRERRRFIYFLHVILHRRVVFMDGSEGHRGSKRPRIWFQSFRPRNPFEF